MSTPTWQVAGNLRGPQGQTGVGTKGDKGDPGTAGAPGLVDRGPWTNGATYAPGDRVYVASTDTVAIARVAHTAATANSPTTAAGAATQWFVLTAAFRFRAAWDTATQYYIGDVVTRNGATYRYVGSDGTTNLDPPAYPAVWIPVASSGRGFTPRGAWALSTVYALDDVVTYLGATYRCILAHTASAAVRAPGQTQGATYWELWAAKGVAGRGFNPRGAWVAGSSSTTIGYAVDDLLTYDGALWRVVTNHNSTSADPQTPSTSNANWELWAAKGLKGDQGLSGTIQAAVQTLPPGSDVTLDNYGNASNALFVIGIPRGDKGEKGDPGSAASAASAGSSPAYGFRVDPVTAHLILEVVQPDSGETFAAYKYDEVFLGIGVANFAWSTGTPSHLTMGLI